LLRIIEIIASILESIMLPRKTGSIILPILAKLWVKLQFSCRSILLLVHVEHPLNLIGIIRLGERQRKQQPRLPRL
jgi:hypothetical protein